MSMIDDYFESQIKYEKKYGRKTIVLYEMGDFYQMYGIDNKKEKVGNIEEVTNLINITLTRSNKRISENSRKNPLMAGFNKIVLDKYIQKFLEYGYTVVLFNQFDRMGYSKKERRMTDVISPGTYIDETNKDSNNILSIYLESNKCFYSGKMLLSIGLSIIDITIGKSVIYEVHDSKEDDNNALDETCRFFIYYSPKEVIINVGKCHLTEKQIVKKFNLSKKLYYFKEVEKTYLKINYQNEFFKRVFNINSPLSSLEYLDFETKLFASVSLLTLLNYVNEHNETLIKNLDKPLVWNQTKYLKMDNNSILQLDITGSNSLFNILNKTSTAIGKRLLKNRLLNPILDKEELEKRYSHLEGIEMKEIMLYEKHLRKIVDLERYHRKICLNRLHPFEFMSLHYSYKSVMQLIKINKMDIVCKNRLKDFMSEYTTIFNLDIAKYKLGDITGSIFKKGIYEDIDKLQDKIEVFQHLFEELIKRLSKFVDKEKIMLKLEHNYRDGYYLTITNVRCIVLKQKMEKQIKIGDMIIETKDFKYSRQKNITKITSPFFKDISKGLVILTDEMKCVAREKYITVLTELYKKYEKDLCIITNFISEIDVIKSLAKVAIQNGYVRPVINISEKSYMKCRKLRHPIIEKIHDDVKYVPNDVDLGGEVNGNLIYGLNGIGKTSYGKSIALCCIMAQMGSFVPAEYMEFSPFHNILTRILGNDNMSKKQSSFVVEMLELRSILKRSDCNSLVIGDEICKGTEYQSGEALVASTIMRLSQQLTNFVFATHMHSLSQMDEITRLQNVKLMHMKVIFEGNNIIYDRVLCDGSGETIYGIEVASKILDDDILIKQAYGIRNKRMAKKDILTMKVSSYNVDLFVDECKICKETDNLDVHHINFQCNADKNGMIEHFHKHEKHNLVVLCKKHHKMVHSNSIIINGYKQDINGEILDYSFVKTKSKKKYSEEQISKIKEVCSNVSNKMATMILKNEHDINISVTTLRKIVNGLY